MYKGSVPKFAAVNCLERPSFVCFCCEQTAFVPSIATKIAIVLGRDVVSDSERSVNNLSQTADDGNCLRFENVSNWPKTAVTCAKFLIRDAKLDIVYLQ